jgi:CO/xanthine dehydrogenase Mo-binding subunit
MIHSKDGSPMKMAPHPAIASGKVCHVGDQVAVVVAETLAQARDAAEKVKVDYAVLPAVADPAATQKAGAPQIHDVAPNNTIYQWHLGDPKAVDAAFKAAKHITKLDIVNNRLVPNAMEPRAALAEYDAGTGAFTLWNTTQNPHVARLVIAAFIGMAPEHKLRVIAPDVGGEGDIEFKDGKFSVAGTDKSAAWGDVTLNAYIAHKFSGQELEPGLKEGAFYDPTNFTFPAGCHICEVEVDPETGNTEIVAWTAVDDFGVLVNPMIVEGQVHGGIAHGIGQALCEGAVYNKDGQLVTGSLMDYCMPRADHLPVMTVATTVTKCPSNPLGIKGCGEAGAIASPAAVINAITDAIGTEAIAMPATPSAVWSALQKSGRSLPRAA